MTRASATCPGGHQNPEHQKFCGECGAPLPVSCPNGHRNPSGQRFCGECGAALGKSLTADDNQHSGPTEDQTSRSAEAQLPITPTVDAPETPPLATTQDPPADFQSPTAEPDCVETDLQVGDRVQVADPRNRYDGRVGLIKQIRRKLITVDFSTSDSFSLLSRLNWISFRSNQLKLISGEFDQPWTKNSAHRSIAAGPSGDELLQHPAEDSRSLRSRLQQHWQGLNRRRKIGWVLAAGVLLLLIAGIANGTSAHDTGSACKADPNMDCRADPSGYLDQMHTAGINGNSNQTLLTIGHGICTDLQHGTPSAAEAAALRQSNPSFTLHQGNVAVDAAMMNLCPQLMRVDNQEPVLLPLE